MHGACTKIKKKPELTVEYVCTNLTGNIDVMRQYVINSFSNF